MKGRPTVYDVANHAGVSIATVSRVLSRPDDVRPGTRSRVLQAVRELHYLPSGNARGLASRRTGVLGLFLPDVDTMVDPHLDLLESTGPDVDVRFDRGPARHRRQSTLYFEEVLRGCEVEAWRRGFSLLVCVARGRSPESLEATLVDAAGKVDGLAVIAQTVPDALLRHLGERLPVVALAGRRHDDHFDHITVRNHAGMRALTEHLLDEHGARDLVYVSGPPDSPDDADRYAGFAQALRSHGIAPETLRVLHGDFTRDCGRRLADALLAEGKLPDALVCGNDQMAMGALDVLAAANLRVPRDVIVTGFDSIDESTTARPPLTTVMQPMQDLGRAAVQMMVERLEQPGLPPVHRELPVTVLLRESCEGDRSQVRARERA